jgi:hypothetical protein
MAASTIERAPQLKRATGIERAPCAIGAFPRPMIALPLDLAGFLVPLDLNR